ncbi:hypothetical protein KCP78_18000 [Salmonella enterica subsp. enterica]|nr:hypothetical protein KCP78_18000 [Salmonella enterica subsp. enterica]
MATAFMLSMPAMPVTTVQKMTGSDDHLNELNERVAKRFHLCAQFGIVMAKENTNGDCCRDPENKDFFEREVFMGCP